MKNKNKIIVLGGAILISILVLLFVFMFLKDSEDVNNPVPSPTSTLKIESPEDVLNIGNNKDTPIEDGIVDEKIINEPMVSDNRDIDVKNYANGNTHEELSSLISFDTDEDVFVLLSMAQSREVELFNYKWTVGSHYHPESGELEMYDLTLPMFYNNDPNEKKGEILYILDSFKNKYPNVIYSVGDDVKNLIDVKHGDIYILSETDYGFFSITISQVVEDDKFFTVNIIASNKIAQFVLGIDSVVTEEIQSIRDVLNSVDRYDELNIIRRIGNDYVIENDRLDWNENTPIEELTPEQKNMLISMGLYTGE